MEGVAVLVSSRVSRGDSTLNTRYAPLSVEQGTPIFLTAKPLRWIRKGDSIRRARRNAASPLLHCTRFVRL